MPDNDKWEAWIRDPYEGSMSSKFNAVVSLITQRIPPEERVIVFSSWSQPLKLLQMRLEREGVTTLLATGDTKGGVDQVVMQFCTTPGVRVLLMTMGVGSVGHTIVQANHGIMMEPHWNAVSKMQAADRMHRFGQTRTVYIYDMLVERSIEPWLQSKCEQKLDATDDFLHAKASELMEDLLTSGVL